MAWSDIRARIRSQLADDGSLRWTDADLERYYNQGVDLQHQLVFRKSKVFEERLPFRSYENDYLRLFLKVQTGTFTPGVQDYSLPADFWRLARVTVSLSPPVQADPVHWNEDWDVRNLPQRAPMPTRPKYALVPVSAATYKVRFYVAPGYKTVPNSTDSYAIYYYRKPIQVASTASPPVDSELPDPFNEAPVHWACFQALMKFHIDGAPYRQAFDSTVDLIVEGASPEVTGSAGEGGS